ncbi:hypothetical protein VNO78_09507 [Psophocarpus tetragonolobus]|uniref:Uncharacterized protein n=1 Tax=Psophocarpus tetragonolobus TaxID=3891 RepID=A0AAN9SW51_PSOTE
MSESRMVGPVPRIKVVQLAPRKSESSLPSFLHRQFREPPSIISLSPLPTLLFIFQNGNTVIPKTPRGHFRNSPPPRNFLRLSCVKPNLHRRIHSQISKP